MGSITSGHAHRARIPAGRFFARRTIGVAAASLLCGAFGFGVCAFTSYDGTLVGVMALPLDPNR